MLLVQQILQPQEGVWEPSVYSQLTRSMGALELCPGILWYEALKPMESDVEELN